MLPLPRCHPGLSPSVSLDHVTPRSGWVSSYTRMVYKPLSLDATITDLPVSSALQYMYVSSNVPSAEQVGRDDVAHQQILREKQH